MLRNALLTTLLLFTCTLLSAQQFSEEDLQKVRLVEATLFSQHIVGNEIADSLSKRLPVQFIKELDARGNLFTDDHVGEIQSLIGEEIPLSDDSLTALLTRSTEIFQQRITFITEMLQGLDRPDFFKNDSLYYSTRPGKGDHALDNRSLEAIWMKTIKANVLSAFASDSLLKTLPDAEVNEALNEQFQYQLEIELCKLEQLQGSEGKIADYVLERYMKAFANCFDPHTEFVKMDYVSWFLAALSDKTFSTGLFFSENKGRYLVKELAPYSSASDFADEIYIGDEIVSVLRNDVKTHPACIAPRWLNQYFNGTISDSVTVEIQSQRDQKIREFTLAKQKLGSRSNHIYSYLLGKDNNRIGYIDFPSFYTEVSEEKGDGASEDLAYTILRLKKANPKGLILDLRNNGGGSTGEAIDLSGFFVNLGPLFYVESSALDPGSHLIKDTKRGRIFTGKIMVLVNELSASAAELVAATMQKHPDVLVVGTRTYGKSTGQMFQSLTAEGEKLPFGSLKITDMKIRGIDGVSYQGKGVTPDIQLPGFYTKQLVSESLDPYALQVPVKNLSARMPSSRSEPIVRLRTAYQERFETDEFLQKLAQRENALSALLEQGFYRSLHFRKFNGEIDRLMDMEFELEAPYFEASSMETDDEFKAYSLLKQERLPKDLQLSEAFKIFEDWILLTK